MSTELERQLRGGFGRLPKPTREASARARAAALDAIGPSVRSSHRWLLVGALALAFVVGAAAAALAATGNLHVRIGARTHAARPVPTRLSVPPGSHGVAVVAGGKLWLATRGGLRIEGMPVSAAELSPGARYAVVGIGRSLVALAPGSRRPWVRQTSGRVLAAAWSPDGLKIAYVVRHGRTDELRLIEGDGSPDRRLVEGVKPVKPAWRSDSLAVAYVDPSGLGAVFDLGSGEGRTFDTRRCGGPAQGVVYSWQAPALAVVSDHGVAVVRRWNRPPSCARFDASASLVAAGWLPSGQVVIAVNRKVGASLQRLAGPNLNETAAAFGRQPLSGLAARPKESSVAVAVRRSSNVAEIGLVSSPARGASLRLNRPLLRIHAAAGPVSISWR
jgi:hypothetical protein